MPLPELTRSRRRSWLSFTPGVSLNHCSKSDGPLVLIVPAEPAKAGFRFGPIGEPSGPTIMGSQGPQSLLYGSVYGVGVSLVHSKSG